MEKSEKIRDKKNLYKAVDLAEDSCIVASDKCFAVEAKPTEALALLCTIVNELKKRIPEEAIFDAVKIGLKSDEERLEMMIDIFKQKFTQE